MTNQWLRKIARGLLLWESIFCAFLFLLNHRQKQRPDKTQGMQVVPLKSESHSFVEISGHFVEKIRKAAIFFQILCL
jgi:hypothetical protein